MPQVAAVVFDAYGTLYDVHSVARECDRLWPGRGDDVSKLWRTKQLEYSWLRTLMGRYEPFDQVTRSALRFACTALKVPLTEGGAAALARAYLALTPFPEVSDALAALRPRPMAILSNGSPDMLEPLVATSGLDRWIGDVISVDQIKCYKPIAAVYQLAVDRLEVAASEILFVSANGWDAAGAKAFGFKVAWVNRTDQPVEGLGVTPDHTIRSLTALADLVA